MRKAIRTYLLADEWLQGILFGVTGCYLSFPVDVSLLFLHSYCDPVICISTIFFDSIKVKVSFILHIAWKPPEGCSIRLFTLEPLMLSIEYMVSGLSSWTAWVGKRFSLCVTISSPKRRQPSLTATTLARIMTQLTSDNIIQPSRNGPSFDHMQERHRGANLVGEGFKAVDKSIISRKIRLATVKVGNLMLLQQIAHSRATLDALCAKSTSSYLYI